MPTQKSSRKLVAYKWVVAVMAVTAVVVGVIIYQVVTSSDSTEEQPIVTVSQDLEEPPDAAVQLEEQEGQIQEAADTPVSTTSTTLPEVQEPVVEEEPVEEVTEDPATGTEVDDSEEDPPTTPVSTTSTTLPEVQEPVVEEEPVEEVTEDPATGTEVDDSEEDPPTTPVSTTSTTLPEVQEPVVEEEPVEEVTEDPATGTEVDDSEEDPPTTPVSTTSTTLPEVQEPVVEEEPVEEVTEDPATGTEVDDSEDWVLQILPDPAWWEESKAIEDYHNCCYDSANSEDRETLKQMNSEFIGDGCDASVYGICRGMVVDQMNAMISRKACPRGWSLNSGTWYDPQYDYLMCSHPDHIFYNYDGAYYPPEEADPRGVPRDYWDSNAG